MEGTRKGRQTPTKSVVLPYSSTYGDKAVEVYNSTGKTAQEWQELLLSDILAYNEDGLWVHTKFGYSVPRRNGKNEIVAIREMYGLKNGEKIWPAESEAEILSQGEVFRIKKTISAEQGDKIQIVLGSSGDNGGDATWISSCAEYTEGDGDNVTYLSDLEWESAEAGYGEVRRDASSEGFQIALTGSDGHPVLYEKGIGTHAQSRIVYNIEGKGYTRFLSDVGVDYSRNPNGYKS